MSILSCSNYLKLLTFTLVLTTVAVRPVIADERKVRDKLTNCAVFLGWTEITSIRWNGKCIDGLADGSGLIEYFIEEKKEWEQTLGGESGMKLERGILNWNFDQNEMLMELADCDKSASYRSVHVRLRRNLDLQSGWVSRRILEFAANFAKEKCPTKRGNNYGNISVVVRMPEDSDRQPSLVARNYEEDVLTWSEWNNKPANDLAYKLKQENAAMVQRKQEDARAETKKRIAEMKSKLESAWTARMEQLFEASEPVEQIADMLRHDKSRFINKFSKSGAIRLSYSNPSFVDSKILVRWLSTTTNIYETLEREFNGNFSWNQWFEKMSDVETDSYFISCLLDPSDVESVSQNVIINVNAKLIKLERRQVIFECRLL